MAIDKRKTGGLTVGFLICAASLHTWAHEGPHIEEARKSRALAATCAACHGTNGNAQGAIPVLAGKPRDYLIEQMQAFKSGKRQATVMHQIAKGYDDRQIWRLADYFSDQK